MFDLRKTAVAVLALGSSAVFAGSMGPVCAPGNVTVGCAQKAWDLSIFALYLRPTVGNDLTYYDSIDINGNSNFRSYDQWNWGFKLEGSFHFNTGNDLTLDWYHLNSNNNYTLNPTYSNQFKVRWDAVNAELAQNSFFGADQKMRFHGGLTYARLSTNNFAIVDGVAITPNTWRSSVTGIGPRTGIDMAYVVSNGVDLYAKGAAAVLVGSGSFYSFADNFSPVYGSRSTVVPELDARLGATYTHNMAQGEVVLDLGWMWTNYFTAQHKNYYSCDANFSVTGPYVGLNYIGNL